MARLWQRFLAYWRLDLDLVCKLSEGLPPDADYHDYQDTKEKEPLHFHTLTCERCGKGFTI